MEFLESTNFFVRVTVYDYCQNLESNKLKFRLIPMVHIGEQNFYSEVKEKILECDELIYEGIQGRRTRLVNGRRKLSEKLGLVMQNDALNLREIKLKLTHGDYTKEEGEIEWEKVNLFEKLKDRIIDPIKLYSLSSNMTRIKLAKFFMKSYRENHLAYGPSFDEPGTTENFYCAKREEKVLQIIKERIASEMTKDKRIGILYGAGHMNRISRNLIDAYDYHVYNGQFIKVFNI